MKTVINILKGMAVGLLAAVIASVAIQNVSASQKISIPQLSEKPLSVDNTVDDVLALMLESDQKWDSMVALYQLTIKDPATNEAGLQNQHFWLDKKGELARVETDGPDAVIFVRDAATIAHEKVNKKLYFQAETPGTFKYDGFNPRELVLNGSGAVYLHPYGKALPTGYYDFIYPTAIAQSMILNQARGKESIQIIGEDEIAGRKTIILSRMPKNHLLWVDVETGVVLKVQYIGESGTWQVQFEAVSVEYDVKIAHSLFQYIASMDAKKVKPSDYFQAISENQ